MTTRSQIIESARRLKGTPFHHQARVPHHGIDCAGLLTETVRPLWPSVVDRTDYARTPDPIVLMQTLADNGLSEIPLSSILPADVLVFWIPPRKGIPQHLAIVSHNGKMIHCVDVRRNGRRVGGVAEVSFNERWRRRVVMAMRFEGIEDG